MKIYQLGERVEKLMEKNCPTDPEKWSASKSAAKSKFDVYPSAYAKVKVVVGKSVKTNETKPNSTRNIRTIYQRRTS